MTSAGNVADHLALSQGHVSAALQQWDAVNLAAWESVCQSLARALTELESARGCVLRGAPSSTPALVLRLGWIRNEAAHLERLIDAAHAFQRGMGLCAGGDGFPEGGASRPGGLGQA